MKTRHFSFIVLSCLIGFAGLFPIAASAQGDLGDLIAGLKSYRYGQSAAPLDRLTILVATSRANADERREIAHALAGVLSTDAAFEAKQFACRQLVFVAGDE